MAMREFTAYNVTLRREDSGEDIALTMVARSPEIAQEHAIDKARRQLSTMAERQYAQFEVVSCVAAVSRS